MKKFEARDQLIARVHRESQLTGFAALICLVKNLFNRYELVETRDEAIARQYQLLKMNRSDATEDLFDERTNPMYSHKPNNIWFNDK